MRRMALLVISTAAIMAGPSLPAFAQGHGGTPQEQQACTRDAQRLCRKDLGDDGAVQGCLQANRTRLSQTCRKVFESHGM